MARLRMNYCSLNDFLFRHKLAPTKYCTHCLSLSNNPKILETANHFLFDCPKYAHQRKRFYQSLKKINSKINPPKCLFPARTTKTNTEIAKVICQYVKDAKEVEFL